VFAVDGYAGIWFTVDLINSQLAEPLSTMVDTCNAEGGTLYLVVSYTFPPSSLTGSFWQIGLGTCSGSILDEL
jgi:hypothetical protein